MTSTAQRYALAALILVALWVVTYWLWPAPGEAYTSPGVTFAGDSAEPAPDLDDPPAVVDPLRDEQPPAIIDDAAQTPAAGSNPPPVVAPRFTEYIVQRGDDMSSIAQKVYGDRNRWDAVAKANPSVDPQRLRPGQTLRIAVDPDNIQGVPLGAGAPPAPDANPTEHVVGDGETLSGIAKSLYGQASLWRIIYDANRQLLRSPEDLRPGMRLLIPPAPAGAGR